MNTSEFVELATLVITIASSLIIPFLQRPILSYTDPFNVDVNSNTTTTKIGMSVTNYGLTPAEDVVISLSSKNAEFENFSLRPFIPNSITTNGTVGYEIIQIGNLAAGQTVNIEGYIHGTMRQIYSWDISPSVFFKISSAYTQAYIVTLQLLITVFGIGASIALIYLSWHHYYRKQAVKEYDYAIKLVE